MSVRGDMSLVGLRPEMPFLVKGYTEVQARRLRVNPRITGVWQLSADRHGMEIDARWRPRAAEIVGRSVCSSFPTEAEQGSAS